MKLKKYILSLASLALITSCDYEDINTNIYGVSDEELGALLYGTSFMDMQQKVIPIGSPTLTTGPGNDLQNTDLISSGTYIGYFGNNNNWAGAGYLEANWNFQDNRMNYAYENFYSKMYQSWNTIYSKLKGSEEPADQEILALANIVKIAGWLRATDVFGPIVYTNAGNGDIAPKLDSQQVIYKTMMADLADAVAILNKSTSKVLGDYDVIYNGNPANWVRFANSLMLRMAVRVHFVDNALAQEYITKALDVKNGGVIEDASQEAKIQNSDKMPLLNSMLASVDEYGETRMGATIWAYLTGYNDPRIAVYFKKGTFYGEENYYGLPQASSFGKQWNDNAASPYFASKPNVNSNSPLYWMRASEVQFLKAEACLYNLMAGDPKTYYEAGVEMSFTENGLTGAGEYLSKETLPSPLGFASLSHHPAYTSPLITGNTSPKWDHYSTSNQKEEQLQKIITQKYLALYPNAVEAWTEYRRTGYPFIGKPEDTSAPARIGASGDCFAPERFRFGATEYSTNPNMKDVPTLLGGEDQGSTKLWWVRSDRPLQK